jgi:hypothetical protein
MKKSRKKRLAIWKIMVSIYKALETLGDNLDNRVLASSSKELEYYQGLEEKLIEEEARLYHFFKEEI